MDRDHFWGNVSLALPGVLYAEYNFTDKLRDPSPPQPWRSAQMAQTSALQRALIFCCTSSADIPRQDSDLKSIASELENLCVSALFCRAPRTATIVDQSIAGPSPSDSKQEHNAARNNVDLSPARHNPEVKRSPGDLFPTRYCTPVSTRSPYGLMHDFTN